MFKPKLPQDTQLQRVNIKIQTKQTENGMALLTPEQINAESILSGSVFRADFNAE